MSPFASVHWGLLIFFLASQFLSSTASSNEPQVQLDHGTFVGTRNGSIDRFLGIPYAKPPVGDLRFRLPAPNDPYQGDNNATNFGPACLQQAMSYAMPDNLAPEGKALLQFLGGSLTINVWKPSNLSSNARIPVVIWIFGGGFEAGDSSAFDGSVIVQRSIDMGEPIIYVSMNYRLSGEEVKTAGVANLGLRDQRQSFHWVQKYITAFNGDPSKVTIWGQSAGADSVAIHMLANHGDKERLFCGAFMQSGPPLPYGDISKGQKYYDQLVADAGCKNATDSLQCLREVPVDVIQDMMNATPSILSPESLHITWVPRADGSFIPDPPMQAVAKDYIAKIPFVSGECDDEATLYVLSQTNITTEDAVHEFMSSNYFPNATTAEVDSLLRLYPQDITQGSPFDTGDLNAITSQSKRLAALQGDLLFMGPRRFFLQQRSDKQPAWAFLSKRFKSFPDFGSFHAHDLLNTYGPGELTDYLVHFVNHLNPNGNGSVHWPRYTTSHPVLTTFLDGAVPSTLEKDDFREEPIRYMNKLLLKYPL
ncbi:carotenoid ester lipase precursor [Irpex rosettiformis]|uniref:Carotenoid ester lipase n=1 Tax=Irpex rosettiformis TaxID=378272 RepID=A0ACB8UBL7_9APHY|nr:carotenoid ester lipase precursor [Irpex rosettiformis]